MRSRREMRAHAAAHESELVVQYLDTLFEQQDELMTQLNSVSRRGLSIGGRMTLVRVAQVVVSVALFAAGYMMHKAGW